MRFHAWRHAQGLQSGFGLIELLLGFALIALLAGAALPSLNALLTKRRVEFLAHDLGAALRYARTQAMASGVPVRVRLSSDGEASCYLVHTGSASDCRCGSGATPHCNAGTVLQQVRVDAASRLQLLSNVPSVRFDPDTGFATPAASISIIDPGSGQGVRQVLSPPGRLRTCRLGPRHAQYPACS